MKTILYLGMALFSAQFAHAANDRYCKEALKVVENHPDWDDAIPRLTLKKEGASFSLPFFGKGELQWIDSSSENGELYMSRPLGSHNPKTGRPGMGRSSDFSVKKIKNEDGAYLVKMGSSYNDRLPEGVNFPIHSVDSMKMIFKNGVCVPTVVRNVPIEKCTAALKKISYKPTDAEDKWPEECRWYVGVKAMWSDKSLGLLKDNGQAPAAAPEEAAPTPSGSAN